MATLAEQPEIGPAASHLQLATPHASRVGAKRVGILTFHRCINYGAYWQVRSLTDYFRSEGHDVQVLDYRSKRYFSKELQHALRPFRPAPKTDVFRFLLKTVKFIRAQQRMDRTPMFSLHSPPNFSDYDLVVVGSDEVWNLRHPWLGGVPLFFGERLAPKQLVSYAASFGNHDSAAGLTPEWISRLRRFDQISVRDSNSFELIDRHLGQTPALVLDPCLLHSSAEVGPAHPAARPYVLVYGNRYCPEFIKATRDWATRQNLRIVSVGYRNEWTDESLISAGPHDFVRLYREASAVATTYFHGCVFALKHRRPFVAQLSDYRANKVRGLLTLLGASHRIFDPANPENVAALLSTPVERTVTETIDRIRSASSAFLNKCLAKCAVFMPTLWLLLCQIDWEDCIDV
jgi:hypothetical protein